MSEESQESLIGLAPIQDWETPFRRAVGTLLQTSLLAARSGFYGDADAILRELESARPEHTSPKYARALALVYARRPEEALEHLKRAFPESEGKDEMAVVLACFALHTMQKTSECSEMLQELLRSGSNEQALSIGQMLANDMAIKV